MDNVKVTTIRSDTVGLYITDNILYLIYTRKSQEDPDKQTTSNEDQTEVSNGLALKKFNLTIPESNIISDSKTGQIAGVRPGFNKMKRIIEWAVKQRYKVKILCWKANRCARNGEEGGYLADHVKFDNIEIITDTSGTFTSENFFMLYLEFGMGSQQSKDISEGVKRNNNLKIRQGIYPGKSPLGYKFNPEKLKGEKDHIPNSKNWNKCREWVEIMLTGEYTVEQSHGVMTAKGLTNNKGGQVSLTKAYSFFRDIFYTGLFKIKGKVEQGIHKPLMTMAEYNKIQKIIDKRGHKNNWDNPLWFEGELIKCSCGGVITGEKHIKKYKNGKIQEFYHARCTKKKNPCFEKFLNVYTTKNGPGLDDQIMKYLNEMEVLSEYTDLIKRILKRRNEQEFQRAGKDRELQTKRLDEIDKQKKALYGMKIDGFYDSSPNEYEQQKAELLKQEMIVKQEIIPDSTAYWSTLLDETCNFVLQMKKLFENGDTYTKKMILKILGSNLILKDKKLQIEAKTAFIALKSVQKELQNVQGWLEPTFEPNIGTDSKSTTFQYRVRESNP